MGGIKGQVESQIDIEKTCRASLGAVPDGGQLGETRHVTCVPTAGQALQNTIPGRQRLFHLV